MLQIIFQYSRDIRFALTRSSDVVLEDPRGQKIMSLALALRAVASALVLALRVLVLGLGLGLVGPGLDYKHVI